MVIVDTTVWSLALRRRPESLGALEQLQVKAWARLTEVGEIVLLGIVRQELLSGVRSKSLFERLQKSLDGFPLALAEREDHDEAADCFNACRQRGISPGDMDMLICAMSLRLNLPIFSTDADFAHYAKVIPIQLFSVNQ